MVFEEAEGHLILSTLYLLWPEVVVIIMTSQTWYADSDGILGTGNDAVVSLRVVLEAEDQTGEHFRIHFRELNWPDLLNHVTGGCGEATSVTYLEGWV